jgi:hypothetical protein
VAAGAAAGDEGLALVHNLDECSHSIQRERRRPELADLLLRIVRRAEARIPGGARRP